jgi:hypothetical protein
MIATTSTAAAALVNRQPCHGRRAEPEKLEKPPSTTPAFTPDHLALIAPLSVTEAPSRASHHTPTNKTARRINLDRGRPTDDGNLARMRGTVKAADGLGITAASVSAPSAAGRDAFGSLKPAAIASCGGRG